MTSLLGRHLGRYHIQEEIGRGGMARVYRAYDPQLQRQIALKVLAPQLALDTEYIQRFQREAIIAANLHHPNIVTIYDVSEIDGLHFIAMEYIRGRSLHAIINERGALGLSNAVAIISAVGTALDYAHRQGAIHRDVKPHNIMINISGRVLLADFGIAQMPEARGDRLTRTGIFIGTPEYISPEQASARHVDGRSDLYSLGITAYELITGTVPFSGATPQLMVAHLQSPPPPLSTLDPQQPPELDSVLARSLAKNADSRYQTGAAFAEALRQVARNHGLQEADATQLAELALSRPLPEGQVTTHVPTDETARQPIAPQPDPNVKPQPVPPAPLPKPDPYAQQDQQPTILPVSQQVTNNQAAPPTNRRGLWIVLGLLLILGLGALFVQGRERLTQEQPTSTSKPIPTLPTSTITASRVPSPSPSAVQPTFTTIVVSPSPEPTARPSAVPTRRPTRQPTAIPAPADTAIPATLTPTDEPATLTPTNEPATLTPTNEPATLTPTLTLTPIPPTPYPPPPSPPPPTATPTVLPTTAVPTLTPTTEPPSPTATASFTVTSIATQTTAPTLTFTAEPTLTPSNTAISNATDTATLAPTDTVQPTPSDTPTP